MNNWIEIAKLDDIPRLGARVVRSDTMDIAVFRTASDQVFALKDECPHRKGPLSQGIVHDTSVTCPLHNWKIDLASGGEEMSGSVQKAISNTTLTTCPYCGVGCGILAAVDQNGELSIQGDPEHPGNRSLNIRQCGYWHTVRPGTASYCPDRNWM